MMSRTSQPLKWHGGKHYLAKRIIELMPPHVHYVEPYFGSGAVMFAKPWEGVSEVVNDIDGELMNFWEVLAHKLQFERFSRVMEAIPFSESHWEGAVASKASLDALFPERIPGGVNKVQRAVAFFVRYRQSRQGLGKDFATLSRNRTRRGMNEQASAWLSAVEGLPAAHERLKRVVILNSDALDVIQQQDGQKTHFYCDPPYLPEVRTTKKCYQNELTEPEKHHARLLNVLAGIAGTFQLSGYRSELYDDYATDFGWRRADFDLPNNASAKKAKDRKIECVWMNY